MSDRYPTRQRLAYRVVERRQSEREHKENLRAFHFQLGHARGGPNVDLDDVRIRFVTPHVIDAAVHDSRGVHDVRFARLMGWSCSCAEPSCTHVAAVRQLVETEMD